MNQTSKPIEKQADITVSAHGETVQELPPKSDRSSQKLTEASLPVAKWWHDWNYKYNSGGGVILAMPNAKGELKEVRFRRVQDPRIKTLIDWWICAMDQLQRDSGGYKNGK